MNEIDQLIIRMMQGSISKLQPSKLKYVYNICLYFVEKPLLDMSIKSPIPGIVAIWFNFDELEI